MATSIFRVTKQSFIDGIDQDFTAAGAWNLGIFYLGDAKAFARRVLLQFDLREDPPAGGRALTDADDILSAFMDSDVTLVSGSPSQAATLERCTRDDWVSGEAHWTRYKVGSNWTAAGGDVSATPAPVAFTTPADEGEHIIGGLADFLTWCNQNNNGLVTMRLRLSDEGDTNIDRWYSCQPAGVTDDARLVIEHSDPQTTPIDRPSGATLGSTRPQRGAPPTSAARAAQPVRPAPIGGNRGS